VKRVDRESTLRGAGVVSCRGTGHGSRWLSVKQLVRLTAVGSVAVLPLMVEDALEIGRRTRLADGDTGAGHAVHLAMKHRAYYATAEPKMAARLLPARWGILDITG
jgi:hypothetical protein